MGKFPPTSEKPTWIHLKIPHGQHMSKKVLNRGGFAEIWVYPDIVDQHAFIKICNKGFKISAHRHGKVNQGTQMGN